MLHVGNKAERCEASVIVAGSRSLVVLRATELSLLRCEGLCARLDRTSATRVRIRILWRQVMRPWIDARLCGSADATHGRRPWCIVCHSAFRALGLWRTIPVTKDKLNLQDDDDWLNAEVDSDRTPRFLAEFCAWTRNDEASDEVAEAVKWGWPVPSLTVH